MAKIKEAGFEILCSDDYRLKGDLPWYGEGERERERKREREGGKEGRKEREIWIVVLSFYRYTFLIGKGCCSLQSFRVSTLGRTCTHVSLTGLELIGMVPKGTTKVHSALLTGADGLIASGKSDIFTPMLRIVARKPLT